MTSSANVDDLTRFRIRGPAIATVPPGLDPRPASGQAWVMDRPRMITGLWQEPGRG
jgi:hypothetical protein